MMNNALKLYLQYPAEMEYWWYAVDELDEDSEAATHLNELLETIAGEEADDFEEALKIVYKSALDAFQDSIIKDLTIRLNTAADEHRLTLSQPKRKDAIGAQNWGWWIKGTNNNAQLGCYFDVEQTGEGHSVLYGNPWIWGGKRVRQVMEQLGNTFHRPTSGSWASGTLPSNPIQILPDSNSDEIVDALAAPLIAALEAYASLMKKDKDKKRSKPATKHT